MSKFKTLCVTLLLLFSVGKALAQPIELVLWHGLAGHLGEEVKRLASEFNQSQTQFLVKPVYKGDYIETLTSFAAAFRAHNPPALVQVFEVGTAMMLSPKGVIKPVAEVMQEADLSLPVDQFIKSAREFYSQNGKLMAMPFNLSAPVLYYNKDVLAQLGYSSTNFPSTWDELEILAQKLKKAGFKCVYTSANPGWILIESYLAMHGLPMVQGKPLKAVYDSPQLTTHLKRLVRWQALGYFRFGGRIDDASVFFTSGLCPLFSQSSGAYNSLKALVPFQLGLAALPLDTQASTIRHANVVGGAALWAVQGLTKEQYKGLAEFFKFIAKTSTQQQWHEHTGYLPLGLEGPYASILKSSQHPALFLAQKDLEGDTQAQSFKNLAPMNQIRAVNDEVLEAMFAGLISPEEALRQAVLRANRLLERFARNTRD
jgi:sn-glycerol 3-phosphate transport system substrate-binding protein